jgi:division/cell wall cluster transcriptional repressor MraZ
MLFTGHSELTIDAKLRLQIPAKYRNAWDESRDGKAWICVPWPGGIVRLYTEACFEGLASQGATGGRATLTPDQDEADLEADLFALAERIEPDSAGRIALPRQHLELAGLGAGGSEVVVIGARNRLEVRDRAVWNQTLSQRFSRLPSLVAKIESRREG